MAPRWPRAAPTSASTPASAAASPATAWPPISLATAVAASASRSLTTTRAPSAAIRIAMARPIPCPAPVTTTPLPSNLFVMRRASPQSRRCTSSNRRTRPESPDKRAFSPELLPCDRTPVDSVGPVGDAQAPGPDVEVGQRRVIADTRTAEDLDGPVDHRDRHRRRGDLDRRDLGARTLGAVAVDQPGRLEDQQPGLVDVDTGLRDQLLYDALVRQVPAERHPRLRPVHHQPKGTLSHPDRAHRVVNPARTQPGLGDHEPISL